MVFKLAGLALCLVGLGGAAVATEGSVPVETVVDYIHAVLASDRTFYTVHVVERMQRRGVVDASEEWRSKSALPLPAQFFQESSKLATLTGVEVQYRLIGLHPINKQNQPSSEFEQRGLEAVMAEPDRPYKGFVTDQGKKRFQALYADHAVSPICVSCHNTHPSSPKHDYKLNDVLGAVVISIPAP
jgi:hypothetical protein